MDDGIPTVSWISCPVCIRWSTWCRGPWETNRVRSRNSPTLRHYVYRSIAFTLWSLSVVKTLHLFVCFFNYFPPFCTYSTIEIEFYCMAGIYFLFFQKYTLHWSWTHGAILFNTLQPSQYSCYPVFRFHVPSYVSPSLFVWHTGIVLLQLQFKHKYQQEGVQLDIQKGSDATRSLASHVFHENINF